MSVQCDFCDLTTDSCDHVTFFAGKRGVFHICEHCTRDAFAYLQNKCAAQPQPKDAYDQNA